MSSDRKPGEHRDDPSGKWKQLNRDLWKKEKIGMTEFAAKSGIKYSALSTILGGNDRTRLTEGNLTKLEQWHIRLDGIHTPAGLQEYLDTLRLCPGYKLDAKQEEGLRAVGSEELRAKGIITEDAFSSTLDKAVKELLAMDEGAFSRWEERQRRENSKFQALIGIFRSWRQW
jgi:hypothetical protein